MCPMFDRQGVETHMLRTTVLKGLGDWLNSSFSALTLYPSKKRLLLSSL